MDSKRTIPTELLQTSKNADENILSIDVKILPPELVALIRSSRTSYIEIQDKESKESIFIETRKLKSNEWNQTKWYKNKKKLLQEKQEKIILDTEETNFLSKKIEYYADYSTQINRMINFIEYNIEFFLGLFTFQYKNKNLQQNQETKEFLSALKDAFEAKTKSNSYAKTSMVDFYEALYGEEKKQTKGLIGANRKLMFKLIDKNPSLQKLLEKQMQAYHSSSIKRWYDKEFPDRDLYLRWFRSCKNKAETLPLRFNLSCIYRSNISNDETNRFLKAEPKQEKQETYFIKVKNRLNDILKIDNDDKASARLKEELKQKIKNITSLDKNLFLYHQDPLQLSIAITNAIQQTCEAAKAFARKHSFLPASLSFLSLTFYKQNKLIETLEKFNRETMTPLITHLSAIEHASKRHNHRK